eukprot:TRINITY_DN575_c0_g1_i2.p1 TRINITY_DN575_c0_g1~~TRINITY_DN575_c0_g1_i2.p1  ORF type:complete len:205 (+),score=43.07 TRINITY_DN575_c0_g1_i2:547-1161(+)
MKNLNMCLDKFLILFLPIERKYNKSLQDDQILVSTEDKLVVREKPQIPLHVILDNLRSAFNVGSIFRTSECLGVSHIYLCGYTATPDQNSDVRRTTMGTWCSVSWSFHSDICSVISSLKEKKIPVYALETVEDSTPIFTPNFIPESGCAVILGNERYGISLNLLKECDGVLHIPCFGTKNSLNVGVAFGICGYELLRQWKYNQL